MTHIIECPCCGDDAAESEANGLFYDEQPLTCGCVGHVSVDEDGAVWVSIADGIPCANHVGVREGSTDAA